MAATSYLVAKKTIYFFLSLSYLINFTYSLCHDNEQSALLQFKDSLSINMSASREALTGPKTASWKLGGENTSDCCSWDGVECNEKTGHVIGLELGSSFLYGSINSTSSLFSLVHLQSLNLADNNFKFSQIPSAISRLSRLSRLNLSASGFSGQIPSELLGLFRLVSLDLAINIDPVSYEGLLRLEKTSLASLVHNLPNLQVLYLGYVQINSPVPQTLANMTSLIHLSLHNCGLTGEFPRSIFLLPNLQIIWLATNEKLKGSLPEFNRRSFITNLELSETSFSGRIPASIANLTELSDLVLSFTYLDGGELLWLAKLTKLTQLYLNGINLKGILPSSLANLTQLNILGLHSNNFVGQIPAWINNMTQLTMLDLSQNKLQGQIPRSFSGLENLQILNLNANNFSGTVEANVFFNLRRLNQLLLSGNHISFLTNNVTDASIPKFKLLGLGSCNLRDFPKFLKFQDELEILSLTENMISEIPDWVFNRSEESFNKFSGSDRYSILPWSRLRILDLRKNMIQGPLPIPSEKMSFYHVSDNKFTGEIPLMMCNMSSLTILNLANNNLSGTIPLCLGSFSSSLTVLNLKANNFRGTIPHTFSEKCSLRMINLSQNKLTGNIPRSLANCSSLEILDFGNNHLEDSFPSWLGALLKLQVLVLSSNRLSGEILRPEISSSLPRLRIIDISNNVLTGYLPVQYIQQWNAMKIPLVDPLVYMELTPTILILNVPWHAVYEYSMTITNKGVKTEYLKILDILIAIDFSSNKFTGEIPDSIGSLKGIQLLNFSNNELTGHIPSSIVNLTNLESLDLSQNKLYGEIPKELAQLNFLAFLNVSFNHLVGSIPLGKQFNTFMNNSYKENLALCGEPLSPACGDSNGQKPSSTVEESDDYEFLTRTEWIVMVTAIGGWMIVGLVFGQTLTTKNHEWFVDKFGKRPKSWQAIARLGEERRNSNM